MTLASVMPPACAFWMSGSRTLMASRMRTSGWIGALASAPAGAADVAVRVDQAGHDDLARDVAPRRRRRARAPRPRADGDDPPAVHDQRAALDLGAVDGDDPRADERDRRVLRRRPGPRPSAAINRMHGGALDGISSADSSRPAGGAPRRAGAGHSPMATSRFASRSLSLMSSVPGDCRMRSAPRSSTSRRYFPGGTGIENPPVTLVVAE